MAQRGRLFQITEVELFADHRRNHINIAHQLSELLGVKALGTIGHRLFRLIVNFDNQWPRASVGVGHGQCLFKITFRMHVDADAAKGGRKQVIFPVGDVVKGAIVNQALGGITLIVDDKDDSRAIVTRHTGQFLRRHLKGAIALQGDHPLPGFDCKAGTESRAETRTNRSPIARCQISDTFR